MTMPRLCIITPVYGATESASVTLGYANARNVLLQCGNVAQLPSDLFFSDDLVRGRSRAACYAVEDTDATHFLWWDNDVVPDDACGITENMLRSGYDVVAAPYPVKRIAARYPYRVGGADKAVRTLEGVNYCVDVDEIAMGFMITSRKALETTIDAYREEKWYSDVRPGKPTREVVAIFDLMFGPIKEHQDGKLYRTLDSEDYSFCRRWRSVGGAVKMYVGPGAPLTHVGPHAYEGKIEDIGKIG
jgi:hypothetical protein